MRVAAVGTLAVLVLLAGARADAAVSEHYGACGEPKLSNTIPEMSTTPSTLKNYKSLYISYEEEATIYCTANDSSKLIIKHNGHSLQANQHNLTTIQLLIGKSNIGRYMYYCIDISTCYENFIEIIVIPKITVSSPEGHSKPHFYTSRYFVLVGEYYEVFCSGQAVENLQMTYDKDEEGMTDLETLGVNKTTTKYKTRAESDEELRYYCRDKTDDSPQLRTYVIVEASYFPDAENFRCISYNGLDEECSWRTSNPKNNFALYLMDLLLCSDHSLEFTRVCMFNLAKVIEGYITLFTLQTCNEFFCYNQTYTVNQESIIKLDPPSELRMLNVTSGSGVVAWRPPEINWLSPEMEHKLEYQLLGTAWQQVNSSAVQCKRHTTKCKFPLNLLCPNAHYKVRLYVRTTASTEDRFWSEPASAFFFTKRQYSGAVNPKCNPEFKLKKPLPSVEGILYEVEELINYERKKELMLVTKIGTLKKKLETVKELMDFLNSND